MSAPIHAPEVAFAHDIRELKQMGCPYDPVTSLPLVLAWIEGRASGLETGREIAVGGLEQVGRDIQAILS